MAEYKVKLLMSEEFVVKANSEADAEQQARDKFGCDYYIDSVEVTKVAKDYDFALNMSDEYKTYTNCDEWGAAALWLNDNQGVEYNFCMDSGQNSCAIYKMYRDEESGTEDTDYSTFEHYEINFDSATWEKELETAMYEAAKKFFKEPIKEEN